MAYHEEYLSQTVSEVIHKTSIECRLLFGGASKVVEKSHKVGIQDI